MGPTRARREEARHSRDARGLPRASPEADGPARAAHVIEQCPATPPCQIGAGARHCCRWTRPDRLRVCRTDLRPSLKAVPATVCAPNGRQRRRQARWPSTAATRMLSRRPFRLRPRAGASFLSAFLSAARRYGESLLASPPTHRHDLFNCEELVPSRVCARTLRLTAVSHRARRSGVLGVEMKTLPVKSKFSWTRKV